MNLELLFLIILNTCNQNLQGIFNIPALISFTRPAAYGLHHKTRRARQYKKPSKCADSISQQGPQPLTVWGSASQ